MRERLGSIGGGKIVKTFQSTLPMRERPEVTAKETRAAKISIHAPDEGATAARAAEKHMPVISIHAPDEGATA